MELQTQKTGQPEQSASGLDTALLAGSIVLLVGGIVLFYYYANWALVLRWLVLLLGVGGSVALAYQTALGKLTWAYLVGSRAELRKVVWPTRQETVQTTLMIALVVIIVGVIMWLLDQVLLFGVHKLIQTGA
jgi:preprotein translocase subunit SecE